MIVCVDFAVLYFVRSEMIVNYRRTMDRHPHPNGVVGGLFPDCGIFFVLDEKSS